MNLAINELVYILKTWNAWYLLEHDSHLKSELSRNTLEVTVTPFDKGKLSDEIQKDLRDYTDFADFDQPGRFYIKFVFPAWEHQPGEIFESLKPVLKLFDDSAIEIVNSMDFIETDLPDKKDMLESLGEKYAEEVKKYLDEQEKGLRQNIPDSPDRIDPMGKPRKLHNEITLNGTLKNGAIEEPVILHNNSELENRELFMEAARLFETIEMNFQPSKGLTDTSPFQCVDENEAALVSLYLGSSSDFRPRIVKGSTVETGATPEELASVVTRVRYQSTFKLFNNPYIHRVRYKHKSQSRATRDMLSNNMFWSCSFLLVSALAALVFFIWRIMGRGE